jgi:hypothetical protein
MAIPNYQVNYVDPNTRTSNLGGFFKTCGIATLNQLTPQTFKWVCAGAGGGDVVVRGLDGNPIYLPSVPAGQIRPALGNMIMTSATIDGVNVSTTASQVVWYGGE